MYHPTDKITYATAFVTPVVEHVMEPKIAQWVSIDLLFMKYDTNLFCLMIYLELVIVD